MSQLLEIIDRTNKQPTIINESSNFVVVTYWWGRGNLNQNTARPCISFYEDLIKKITKFFINLINTGVKNLRDKDKTSGVIKKIFNSFKQGKTTFTYKQIISKSAFSYMNSIYEYCKIDNKSTNKDESANAILEKLKETRHTPIDFVYKNQEQVENILMNIIKYIVVSNETEITQLFIINDQVTALKAEFTESNETEYVTIKNKLSTLEEKKTEINNKIRANLRVKKIHDPSTTFDDPKYNNTNIFDILNIELRYMSPLNFEEMIEKWEGECGKFNCNFLSVEYPEFAQPGGYQMAINAKPLFIKKALDLCVNKNVLYIDGDMYIRKYPVIFDMKDVDFMARGWWVDPRSSWKMTESIMYDPYTFETSGGTMFFSQSKESRVLIDKWISESAKSYNAGKADDRILSLIFNTHKFLCNMKIIQLPIEYLWLSLDYDERLLDELYDYDTSKMMESIIIEHPECLTSEDTAAGAGASSDRTPKFYSFLEDLTPTSELLHEYIFFPNKEMTDAFKDYLNYMNNITYLNDGNEDLIQKGYVDPINPLNNEQPIYVINYDDKYGNKKYVSEDELTVNQVVELNMKRSEQMNIDGLNLITLEDNTIEIQNNDNSIDNAKIIALIIKLLKSGKYVIYNPTTKPNYDNKYYEVLKSKISMYKSLDFVFVPEIKSFIFSNFFKPTIKTNMPMFFSPGNDILIQFLSMFLSLDELSDYINNGSYEFMSRIRVGYLLSKKVNPPASGGGSDDGSDNTTTKINQYIEEYESGLEEMYMSGGRKNIKKHKTYKKRGARKLRGKNTRRHHK